MEQHHDPKPKKKVHIETWGCQMNVADSERMLALLKEKNYQLTTDEAEADLLVLNTCHIREKAKHKVVSKLGRLRQPGQVKAGAKVAVTGCVAQAEGKNLIRDISNVDMVLGPGKIDELPDVLARIDSGERKVAALGFDKKKTVKSERTAAKQVMTGKTEVSRFVNINEGCNNFCTFCVVPFTRGPEISRTAEEILTESRNLIAAGAKEITLLGQNVNSYGLDLVRKGFDEVGAEPFANLLAEVAKIDGLERLRFTTSNPHDFTRPLAELFAAEPKLGSYIHLPVQSGNDEVLARMKRKVTAAEYLERVQWLRSARPDMAISTDLIVGFPGETEAQFEDTLALMEQVRFSFVFSFKYSIRKNTAAARFKDQVDEKVKTTRLHKLQALQDKITMEINSAEIGATREVLFHYQSTKEPGIYYGRTPSFHLVKVAATRDLVGTTAPVTIIAANTTALEGRLS